jgi:glycosyltransferase involved in cell wall biosynthesis
MDVWVLDWEVFSDFDVVSWVPVDHEPTPAPVRRFFERSGAVPMAMSKFGAEQLTNDGLEPLYVPHAVDTQNYRLQDKAKAREKVGLPADDFIVGMVAANKGNPSRKCFAEAFQAFKVLHDRHPEARLYLHTEMNGRFDGVNLPALLTATGIDLKAVSFADQYRVVHLPITQKSMAGIYSSMDVLLSPSAGEGFGIPVVEAQAAGVPVIVSDFSAQPELCASGWTVEGVRHYTPIGSWQFRPNVESIADRLETAYALRDDEKQRKAARDLAKQYDVRRVLDKYMLPALEQARERFAERKPTKLEPVAA